MRISDWSSDVCASDLEPIFVPATAAKGFMPDYHALDPKLLDRTAFCFLNSPANPQGAAADLDYLANLDRKSVVSGKSVSVRVDLGGRRIIKKKKKITHDTCIET